MTSKKKFSWLISPKSFIQLIGAEYEILRKSGSVSLVKFYIAALAIFLILLISACSIFYAMDLLFHMLYVEVVLSILVSLLFVFIYIFLLNTYSKNIFNLDKNKDARTWYRRIKLSDFIRITFIVFIAFLISKPIEAFIFQNKLAVKVKLHRLELLNNSKEKLKILFKEDIQQMQNSISFYKRQLIDHSSPTLQQEIVRLSNRINGIKQKQAFEMQRVNISIDNSDFLLFRIKEISKSPIAMIICLAVICLFLLPGFLIYSISAADSYYKLKREYEINLVTEEYRVFEELYSDIFKKFYHLDRVYYSKFLDPPFNSQLKPSPSFQSQNDFLQKYSSD